MHLVDYTAHAKDTPVLLAKTKRHGLPIKIEHKKGSTRQLHDDEGNVVYKVHMHHDYGYFAKTVGRDGDEVDCFLGPMQNAKEVYIVHMKDMGPVPSAREDEDKCMVGFPSADAAKAAFLAHYPKSFYESMTAMPVEVFKQKLKSASLPYHRRKIHAERRVATPELARANRSNSIQKPLRGGVSQVDAASTNKCPWCGHSNIHRIGPDFGTAQCPACGHTFQVEASVSNLTAEPGIKCAYCHTMNAVGDMKCSKCGMDMKARKRSTMASAYRKAHKTLRQAKALVSQAQELLRGALVVAVLVGIGNCAGNALYGQTPITGQVRAANGTAFNGRFQISLARSSVVITCTNKWDNRIPWQQALLSWDDTTSLPGTTAVASIKQVSVKVTNGVLGAISLFPNACLTPQQNYTVLVYDSKNRYMYRTAWFVPAASSATLADLTRAP